MAPKWAAKMPKLSIRSSGLSVPNHNKSQRIVANRNDPRVLCFVAVCFALFFHTCAPADGNVVERMCYCGEFIGTMLAEIGAFGKVLTQQALVLSLLPRC